MKHHNPTIQDILSSPCGSRNQHLENCSEKSNSSKSKYKNKLTEVDGIKFDSIKEAKRYVDLKKLLKAGQIAFLKLQVEYELNPGGTYSYKYVADFTYTEADGRQIVEDAKGYVTKEFARKKRLMKKVHGIDILET